MNLMDLELVEYSEEMGRIVWPVGFEHVLAGKPIEQQLAHYRILDWWPGPLSYYLTNWAACNWLKPLGDWCGWEKIILRDVRVVGFVYRGRTILPYQMVEEDVTSENNGAGYKERTDRYVLVCVPEQLDRKRVFTPPFGAPVPELDVPVVPYDGSHGPSPLPEGFAARLEGKPLAVQMYYFAIHNCNPSARTGWEDDWKKYSCYILEDLVRHRGGHLPFRNDLEALIVQDGLIVGVRIRLPENAVDAASADLYPYEAITYHYSYPFSTTRYPARLQLICKSLPA